MSLSMLRRPLELVPMDDESETQDEAMSWQPRVDIAPAGNGVDEELAFRQPLSVLAI